MAAWAFFKKREMKGITLKPAIFYGTYVHSEKLRIKEGKLKNKKRLEIQSIHAKERRRDRYLCGPGERPAMDKYWQVSFFKI
jgi:hypothetical protein